MSVKYILICFSQRVKTGTQVKDCIFLWFLDNFHFFHSKR